METLRILWFNWRDIKNPEAGGAEIYTHEIAKRLAKDHALTLFTSKFKDCQNEEFIDGVKVIRAGGKYSVYEKASSFYEENNNFDIVLDEINTRPFLTPKFVKRSKILALLHQLAKEFWFYETPFPINMIGYILEGRWLKNYIKIPTITVSNSTKKDLEDLKFNKIYIVHNGLNVEPISKPNGKNIKPTIIYIGRMKRAKKPGDVIRAFEIVRHQISNIELWMVGDGYLRNELEKIAGNGIKFYGHVDDKIKIELMKMAWIIAVPGVREGWGQVVTDANALGTPAVGYNIPGLRDSIRHEYNGLLVGRNSKALAEGLITILTNEELRVNLSKNSIKWAKQFNWDKSANNFLNVIRNNF